MIYHGSKCRVLNQSVPSVVIKIVVNDMKNHNCKAILP